MNEQELWKSTLLHLLGGLHSRLFAGMGD